MRIIYTFCLAILAIAEAAPGRFVFPDQRRHEKKLDPITPPVLPVLEHLERDPSTLLPGEGGSRVPAQVKPRFGHGAFNVRPSGNGGLSASISSSASGAGISQSASQSFSFGFNEGFSASHSASQAASFNGFGSSFSGSQASSQAASFSGAGASLSGAASSASALGGFNSFGATPGYNSLGGSQSASQAFGFNSPNAFQPDAYSGNGLLDVRHRGVPGFPFPDLIGRSKSLNAVAFKRPLARNDDFLALLVSN
ncbi:hypothetical protein KGM_201441 [Danaus plexippus plexippus]|uniref:Uncharacterized protein n=1 Tax=Danaus plexippus plexippus TaxID=278856 RepID=A0A212EL33_DANPL|nr:hypothetical protein KGM_201441 [Danaus plexippus plexippus]